MASGNMSDLLRLLFGAGGGAGDAGDSGGNDGGDTDKDPMMDPEHPAVEALFNKLMDARKEMLDAQIAEDGRDAVLDINNPQGIICGLMDFSVAEFATSPVGTMLMLTDKLESNMKMQKRRPGKFLHQVAHLMFDLGRQYEIELQKHGADWVQQEQAVGVVPLSEAWKSWAEDDTPDEDVGDDGAEQSETDGD